MLTDDTVLCAYVFASLQHSRQMRLISKKPYIEHLANVYDLVKCMGGNANECAAAWLHDIMEDQAVNQETLQQLFGYKIASIVSECTDTLVYPKSEWKLRKQWQLNRISNGSLSKSAIVVKIADAIVNTRDTLSELNAGIDVFDLLGTGKEKLWYYQGLVQSFVIATRGFPDLEVWLHLLRSIVNCIDRAYQS